MVASASAGAAVGRAIALLAGVALGWYLCETYRRSRSELEELVTDAADVLRRARRLEAELAGELEPVAARRAARSSLH